MEDRLRVAKSIAREAGALIRDNFEKTHEIELKMDMSPVTETDRQVNAYVAGALKEAFPDDGLLGEEESYGGGDEEYQWVCDPLDGTKPFILGLPMSVFMLALSRRGKVLLSVVYDPYSDKLYHAAKGEGAFCNDEPIRVNSDGIGEGYVLIGTNSFEYLQELKKVARGVEPVPGTGYKCMMMASGRGVGMINSSADFHDIGPASLIVEEAGGRVTGLNGEELDYSKEIGGVIVSNGTAHDDLLKIAAASK